MRKDWLVADPALDEASFVAEFWDQKWETLPGDDSVARTVRATEEHAFLRRVEPRLRDRDLEVLDCGCGRGDWTRALRGEGHRAVGVDLAPRTIRALQSRHPDWFLLGDFRRLDLPDDSFDLILNWGGIEHFEEGPLPAIREAHRVLRAGGRLLATTPCHNLRIRARDALGGADHDPEDPRLRFYQYRFAPRELAEAFRQAGFQGVRTRVIGGRQGVARSLTTELGWLGAALPRMVRLALERTLGPMLRPVLGHMVICVGTKPSPGGAPSDELKVRS